MFKKVLLLNYNYQILSFINERKAIRLFFKGKVDVLSVWKDIKLFSVNGKDIYLPALIKLKYFVRKRETKLCYSRKAVFKRDLYVCQICARKLSAGQATVDHIIPKKLGGETSFANCITACHPCNAKKGSKTLEQANMSLIKTPITPSKFLHFLSEQDAWHEDWNDFFGGERKF